MDEDEGERYISRWGPMFSNGSLAKADLATNVAIPLVAEGGWGALTLRTMASAANVTPQAIAAWFPSVTAMRVAIAERYGQRWIRERGLVASRRISREPLGSVTPAQVALALLPETWQETVFDSVWLAVVEAGRWHEGVGSAVAAVEEQVRVARTSVHDPLTAERATAALLSAISDPRSAAVGGHFPERRADVGDVDERGDREDQVDQPER